VVNLSYFIGSDHAPHVAMKLNILGMDNCFEAARILGVRHTMYASSLAVNGKQAHYGNRPVTEDDRVNGEYQYAKHKIVNEWQAQDYTEKFGMVGQRPGASSAHSGSSELLDVALEALNIARDNKALVVARHGTIIDINQRALELCGFAAGDLLGQNVMAALFDGPPPSPTTTRWDTQLKSQSPATIVIEVVRQPLGSKLSDIEVYAIRDLRERREAWRLRVSPYVSGGRVGSSRHLAHSSVITESLADGRSAAAPAVFGTPSIS
jgi:PAS domain-containing protein